MKVGLIKRVHFSKMKVVLYIGHHKVGSTALQSFFAQNWHSFATRGILYPSVEAMGAARNLKSLIDGANPPRLQSTVVREPHNALAFAMLSDAKGGEMPPYQQGLPELEEMWRYVDQQITMLKPETLVLCSEVMSNFGKAAPELIDVLKTKFKGAEIEIYCALRAPDQYLASWHGQRLKLGHQVEPLSGKAALQYRKGVHFDYAGMLRPWLAAFPQATFHIRNYADILETGGAVEDFLAQTGLECPDPSPIKGAANPSLPYATYEIMRRANYALSRDDQQKLRNHMTRERMRKRLPPNKDIELFGEDVRRKLYKSFAPIHQEISDIAGVDEFFPGLESMLQTNPVAEADVMGEALNKVNLTWERSLLPRSVRLYLWKCTYRQWFGRN